jgi:hypothetical protein
VKKAKCVTIDASLLAEAEEAAARLGGLRLYAPWRLLLGLVVFFEDVCQLFLEHATPGGGPEKPYRLLSISTQMLLLRVLC